MSFQTDNDGDSPPLIGRYSVLRKNFLRDFMLATIFLMCFVGTFLIGWDVWIVPSGFQPKIKWYCTGISLLAAIVITVPISVILNLIQRVIDKQKQQNELKKDK